MTHKTPLIPADVEFITVPEGQISALNILFHFSIPRDNNYLYFTDEKPEILNVILPKVYYSMLKG